MAQKPAAQKPIMALKRAHCAQMFFIYPGRANRVENFLNLIQKTGLSNRNLVLIRDFHAANYSQGVSPEIPTLDALLDWHVAHLKSHPRVTEFHMIGNSSGGYGAMLFGYLLGAQKVFVFAPRTAQLETAEAAKASLKELMATGNGVTEYFIHFAPTNKRDTAFARYFEGSPGVVLCPHDKTVPGWWDHALMGGLVENGEMRDFLPPYLAAAPAKSAPEA
jgi:hypothetical protein